MDQIISYSQIKTLSDINKTLASIPCMVIANEEGTPKFTIANYEEFKDLITRLVSEFTQENIVVTDRNVADYEKDASSINHLIKQIKDDAKTFVDDFALPLLGRGGRKPFKGQVQELSEILKSTYDTIHSKTVSYREAVRLEKEKENAIEVEATECDLIIEDNLKEVIVIVPQFKMDSFKNYCLENNISIKGEK